MNFQLTVDKKHWLTRNPDIKFHRMKKAFYGTHLLKVKLNICGASMRYYHQGSPLAMHIKNPNYKQFMKFLKLHLVRFNLEKMVKVVEDRYIHVNRSDSRVGNKFLVYDVNTLYALYNMLKKKPDGIRFSRVNSTLHVYSNNIDDIEEVINQLKIPTHNIIEITSPDEQDIAVLLAGKEFSNKADKFKYKVFLKSFNNNSIPSLSNYLESIKDTDEVEVPYHCKIAIKGPHGPWTWETTERSYLYAKNEDTILLIKLLAGSRYSTCIELILPKKDLDK